MIEELLCCYINNKQLSIELSDSDIILLIEQSLQTLLFPVTHNKEYRKYYISWVVKQEEFFSIQNDISQIFNDKNINHIYFKGSIISKLYDDPSVRTRGDIDLYVSPNDISKAKKLLLDNGFEIDNQLDLDFKPGLYKQVEAFLSDEKDERLLTIESQFKHLDFYEKIDLV